MDIQAFGRMAIPRRQFFTHLRWGAVVAGTVVAGATYLLLALLGVAVGLSAVAPADGSIGRVSLLTGGWTVLCVLVAIYIGGYVAGRVSGLSRRSDGVVHGFITWGAMALLFVWLTTTSLGGVLGGAFGVLGQDVVGLARQSTVSTLELDNRLAALLGPGESEALDAPARQVLAQRLLTADRAGAIDLLMGQLGVPRDRAATLVDRLPMARAAGPDAGRIGSEGDLTAASWWLFAALALSLLGGMWGGAMGTRSVSLRTVGDHSAERHLHTSA